jgi:hypothetical protein
MRHGDTKTRRRDSRRRTRPQPLSSSLCLAASVAPPAPAHPGAPSPGKLQNEPTAVRESRTRCYKMLQSATTKRALIRHPDPTLPVLAFVGVLRVSAVRFHGTPRTHRPSEIRRTNPCAILSHTRQSAPNCSNAPHPSAKCKSNPPLPPTAHCLPPTAPACPAPPPPIYLRLPEVP